MEDVKERSALTHGGSEFSRNNGDLFSRRNERNAPREINTRAHRIRARNKSVPSKNFIHCDFFSFSFFFFSRQSEVPASPIRWFTATRIPRDPASFTGSISSENREEPIRRILPSFLLVPCIILFTFYLSLERSRSGRILDKVFQRKGGIVIA